MNQTPRFVTGPTKKKSTGGKTAVQRSHGRCYLPQRRLGVFFSHDLYLGLADFSDLDGI